MLTFAMALDSAASSLIEELERALVRALRARKGRATLGDLVRDTGLPSLKTEAALRSMLSLYESHLAVDEDGELLYLFEAKLVRRQKRGLASSLRGFGRAAYKAFVVAFKVATMVILITYVLTFCVLIIAAFVAMLFVGEDGGLFDLGDLGDLGEMGFFAGLVDLLFFWDVGTVEYIPLLALEALEGEQAQAHAHAHAHAHGAPSKGPLRYGCDTYQARRSKRPHFYEDVFGFVFGPPVPDPPAMAAEREILASIDDKAGVFTLTDLVSRTGSTADAADQEMARLMGMYEGDVVVSDFGDLIYTFQNLRVTSGSKGLDNVPAPPAWHRFEARQPLTGNSTGRNTLIGAMALFTLMMSLLSPIILFPVLNIGAFGVAFLAIIPFFVSVAFFMIPVIRSFAVGAENKRRWQRNLRRAVLFTVFEHLESDHDVLVRDRVHPRVVEVLTTLNDRPKGARTMNGLERVTSQAVDAELDAILAEFEADIDANDDGEIVLRFSAQRSELREAELLRDQVGRGVVRMEEIAYSSAEEDPEQVGEPELSEEVVEVVSQSSQSGWEDDKW